MTSTAARLAPVNSTAGSAQSVLFLGSPAVAGRLRELFRHSHWRLEWVGNLEHAAEKLSACGHPVVMCGRDWPRVAAFVSGARRAPVVIAVDDDANGATCQSAIDANVLYLDGQNLGPGRLFPLLNHAWRLWNQEATS